MHTNEKLQGTSLEVQWLRLHAPNAGGPGSIPGQGTRFKIPCAATNTLLSQVSKINLKKKRNFKIGKVVTLGDGGKRMQLGRVT